MPVAWFQIGMDYWTIGKHSEGLASKENTKAFNKNKQDVALIITTDNDSREFAIALKVALEG